jgi:hypothetical protein
MLSKARKTSRRSATRSASEDGWAKMIDRALVDGTQKYIDNSKTTYSWFKEFKDISGAGAGDSDQIISYRQRDHRALMSLFTTLLTKSDILTTLLRDVFDRVVELENELSAVKALPAVTYRGVYRDGDEYQPGSMVTFAGSTWHVNEVTRERPGEGSKAWTLAVKRGRDGRDSGVVK